MALGAQKEDVLRLILRQGTELISMGGVVGFFGAVISTRFLASLLFGVRVTDPVIYICVTILFVLVALAACYLPARRATHIDPLQALHTE
jgi:ABC-type antimicrobial peptide transport system permease subunit